MKQLALPLFILLSPIWLIGCLSPHQVYYTLLASPREITLAERDKRTIPLRPHAIFRYLNWRPCRIALDTTGSVYGLFERNHGREWRLVRLEPDGKWNQEIWVREISESTPSKFSMRRMDVVTDSQGNFIILDAYSLRVLKVRHDRKVVASFKISDEPMVEAYSIAIDNDGFLWVSASKPKPIFRGRTHQLLKLDPMGNQINRFQTDLPFSGLSANKSGEIYGVQTAGGNRSVIYRFRPDGKVCQRWLTPGYWKNFYALSPIPDLAIGPAGNIYIAAFYEMDVQIYNPAGELLARFTLPAPQGGDQNKGTGRLPRPCGIVVNDRGEIFVADWGNNAILKYNWPSQ